MTCVDFKDVWEMYRIEFVKNGKRQAEDFWALQGATFSLGKGEILGIIGENGSGKSTLLKIIAGIIKPSKGSVTISGRVAGLLDLGAGFQPELTGQENICFNASLFGLTQKQIDDVYPDIESFAALGKFIYAPVQCYSQGMFVRLAFSTAIHINPDILVIDDTLSVGDEYFQKKCLKKIFELKEMRKTIAFATHDMSILKKLTQRAMLLKDGRIECDGPVSKVLPLYTQTVGAKQGVAILESGHLKLVFNNGRIFLLWEDRLLTSQAGICVNFLIERTWCNSSEAEWQVEKRENTVVAKGGFYRFDVVQIWTITLTAGRQLVFDMRFEGKDSLDIRERCLSMMLSHEYERWLTLIGEGIFPSIDEKMTAWTDVIGGDSPPYLVGFETSGGVPRGLPGIVIEQENPAPSARIRLLNTDHFTNARVLEYREQRMADTSSFPEYSSLGFSGRMIIGCDDLNGYFQRAESGHSLIKDHLKLIFDKGKCLLFNDEQKLSKDRGFTTVFRIHNMWHPSELAHWQCRKENERKLVAKGVWPHLGITQIWTIEIHKDNAFSWLVEMEIEQALEIFEQYLLLMFPEKYNLYQSDYGCGHFPESFLENEVDVLQRGIPKGRVCLMNSDNAVPSFSLEVSEPRESFIKIFNSDVSHRARDLRVGRVEPESKNKFEKGRHFCFKVMGKIEEGAESLSGNFEKNLRRGDMGFSFDRGSGRIFWGASELTRQLGVYTSFNFHGRWYNSPSDAVWTQEEQLDGMCFTGKWFKLPLVQTWQFNLGSPDSVSWKIKLNVLEPITFQRAQVNVMLSELYARWVAPDSRGIFPPFKENTDGEWPVVWRHNGISGGGTENVQILSAHQEAHLPEINFSAVNNGDLKTFLCLTNSDICHRSRVLECRIETGQGILMPGAYTICDSTVMVAKT